jgi:transcription initiation factor TFIIH subunit 3
MMYSSTDPLQNDGQTIDANSYPPFRVVDSSVMQHIMEEVEALGEPGEEGQYVDNTMSAIRQFTLS